MLFNFDNTLAEQLEGFYTPAQSAKAPAPEIIKINTQLAEQLGLNLSALNDHQLLEIFSGQSAPEGSSPLALVYAGHQFGGFSQRLGDGRALLLGEVLDKEGARFDIQLKGSGRTPYSRGGDGKSALGPVLREYMVSEAMHALGVPTTRALAAVLTGEQVVRDRPLPGGVFTRVAASHIRIGSFQYFAARGETDKVRQLADYAIARHYPVLGEEQNPYLSLLAAVADAQASLVAQWMLIGFIHGVMNTDNMTVSGETIDYGPCAFMDVYAPGTVFSSIDTQGRYAYQNQAPIAQWNLARLAETLLPLIDEDGDQAVELAMQVINQFPEKYTEYWLSGMRKKIGLREIHVEDVALINDLLASMDGQDVDYTQLFRSLADVLLGQKESAQALFTNASAFNAWLVRWQQRLAKENSMTEQKVSLMNSVNPIYIPRNHKIEEAIEAAVESADFSKFEILNEILSRPYEHQQERENYALGAPESFAAYKTFCGT